MDSRGRVFSVEKALEQKGLRRNYQLMLSFNGYELALLKKKADALHLRLATYVRMASLNYKRRD